MSYNFLKSFDEDRQYLDLDSESIISLCEKTVDIIGWFSIIKNSLSAIYVDNGKIIYRFGGYTTVISKNCRAFVEKYKKMQYQFKLYQDETLMHSFIYYLDDTIIGVEPFEYIDESDLNWGIFLSNIINSKERQMNLIKSLV